jgi:hypothetical protein
MLTKDELMKMWDEAKANGKRLDECYGPHDFIADGHAERPSAQRYVCLKCKGTVDWSPHHWYKLGLKHGGRG